MIVLALQKRSKSGYVCMQWPGVQGLKDPPHAQLQLFGGAAFERCMSEFQTAVTSLSFPSGKTLHQLPCLHLGIDQLLLLTVPSLICVTQH